LPEILLQVRDEEPVVPRRLNPSVPADLQTICLKCLQKEPGRRYLTAQELADDLARFLAHEPICARPVFALEKMLMWAKRRPAFATLILALHLVLLLGIIGVLWQWRRAEGSARGEREQRRVAEEFASWVQLNLYAGDVSFAAQALQRSDLGLARRTLAALKPKRGEKDLRGFEWYYLWRQCRGDQIATLGSHDWIVTCAAFSPDGKLLATGSEDATVKIWEVASRALVTTLTGTTGAVLSVEFTPDNRQLVTAGQGGTYVWDCAAWKITNAFNGEFATLARTSPLLATAEVSYFHWWQPPGSVRIWNYRTGEKTFELPEPRRVIALAPDGKTLACGGLDRGVELWDIPSGKMRQTFATSNTVRSLVFSRDGTRLMAVVRAHSPMLFELNSSAAPRNLDGHSMEVWGVNFSPDGRRFATTSSDQTLRLWSATSFEPQQILRGHEHEVWCVAFSPDGKTLVSGSKDCQVMLWSVEPRERERSLPHQTTAQPFFSPAGDKIVTLGSPDAKTSSTLWNLGDASRSQTVPGKRALGFSPDGKQLIRWGHYIRSLEYLSLDTTNIAEVALLGSDETSKNLQYQGFTPDWRRFFTIDESGRVRIWEVATGKLLHVMSGPPKVSAAALSPAGKYLALAERQNGAVWLFDCSTGGERRLVGHKDSVLCLAFSSDNNLLASGSLDGKIRLWNPATGGMVAELPGHMEETSDLAFSPDGRTLASVDEKVSVKLWHIATRRELISWDFPQADNWIRFSPDGRFLAVTTQTNSIRLFEAPADTGN
jgi:WD40 repeat protein